MDWQGSATLRTSGSPTELLAFTRATVVSCEAVPAFEVVAVGPSDDCLLVWIDDHFRPDIEPTCKLTFGQEHKMLRVTDGVARRYGLHLGGDDVATGKHDVYDFSVSEWSENPQPPVDRCALERARRPVLRQLPSNSQ